MQRWSRFWFADAPYFDLALMRILFVGLQLFLMLLFGFEGNYYVNALPDTMWQAIPTFRLASPWSLGLRPSADTVMLVFWCTFVAGVVSLAGLWSSLTTLAFAVGNIYLQAYQYSFGEMHHAEAVMVIALLAISLGPCGRVLSLDDWLRSKRAGVALPRVPLLELRGPDAGWPIRFMQCFIPLMYLSAMLSKVTLAGEGWSLEWANGITLQKYLAIDGARWGSSLAIWASQSHTPVMLAQWAVLIFQATYFVTVFSSRMRWIYIPIGLVFHIGIYLTLRAGFPQWIAASAFYVPWATALLLLLRQGTTVQERASA